MENTEITLNGTDWSNLYIIDYAGGCGGEKMGDFISEKIDAQFTIPKTLTDPSIDSFDNMYITPLLHLMHDDINLYEGYKGKDTNGLFHSEEMMKHNLKINLIHRYCDHSQQMRVASEDEIDSLVIDTHFTKNFILRSHRNIDWKSFTKARIIRIYPWVDSHLTHSLMMIKRWIELDPVHVRDFGRYMTSDMIEWIMSNIFSKTPDILWGWQRELVMTNRLQDFNWRSFVDESFKEAAGFEKPYKSVLGQSIPSVEWVFDSSDVPSTKIKTITGIDVMPDDVKNWQQSNVDLLAEHGISMTSTKEECITYFKNYWDLNNIPCVTEI